MAMLVIDGLTVKATVNGGIAGRIADLSDRGRAISGHLLVTQLHSGTNDYKETLSCATAPLESDDAAALITKLKSAATLPITGEVGSFTAAAVYTGRTPIKAGGGVRWVVNFDLIED